MAGKEWTIEEIEFLKKNFEDKTCEELAVILGRTTRSTQHKFGQLGLQRKKASIGDVVNGWLIVDIFIKDLGSQNVTYTKLHSVLGDNKEREERLTKVTLKQIGWPDRRRPDVTVKNTTHGGTKCRLYSIWNAMKNRCSYAKGKQFKDYGGRGIRVCDEWMKFETFKEWAEQNGYSDKLTIDRKDVNGNYEPSNCKWSTWLEQCSNKRNSSKVELTAFGETKSIYEWAADSRCSVNVNTLQHRFFADWSHEEAITESSQRKRKLSQKEFFIQNHPDAYEAYLNQ